MNKLAPAFVYTLLASLSSVAHAQHPQSTFDAYAHLQRDARQCSSRRLRLLRE